MGTCPALHGARSRGCKGRGVSGIGGVGGVGGAPDRVRGWLSGAPGQGVLDGGGGC